MNHSSPKRIQRRRTKGWRMPPNTTYVGRPSRWGNPFYPNSGLGYGFFDEQMRATQYDVRNPRVQVHWFRQHMTIMAAEQPEKFAAFIEPLRGKNLACWCAVDKPCHADVLLEIANHG